ncbi:MAG: zinc-ribbon domain-containing protein [Acholeplasmataceae bacterium]|nr:zinc-ribbon domain-containing protein [Acholeplasmataceae bacterium]
MAFCRNCGSEVLENAYVCTKCGALVNGKSKQKIKIQLEEKLTGIEHAKSFKLLFTTGIIHVLSLGIHFISLAWMTDFQPSSYMIFVTPDSIMTTISFILAFVAFILAIITHITAISDYNNDIVNGVFRKVTLFILIATAIIMLGKIYPTIISLD